MKRKATQRKAVLDATTTEEDAKAIAKQLELSTANANKNDLSKMSLDTRSVAVPNLLIFLIPILFQFKKMSYQIGVKLLVIPRLFKLSGMHKSDHAV